LKKRWSYLMPKNIATTINHYFVIYKKDDINKPDSAQPFMQQGVPHSFAQSVFENLYYFSTEKEKIVADIEDGNLYFCIFDATEDELPENADVMPLREFSISESEIMRKEANNILYYRNLKNILTTIQSFSFNAQEHAGY